MRLRIQFDIPLGTNIIKCEINSKLLRFKSIRKILKAHLDPNIGK